MLPGPKDSRWSPYRCVCVCVCMRVSDTTHSIHQAQLFMGFMVLLFFSKFNLTSASSPSFPCPLSRFAKSFSCMRLNWYAMG